MPQLEPQAKRVIDYNSVTDASMDSELLIILPSGESDRTRRITLTALKALLDAAAT